MALPWLESAMGRIQESLDAGALPHALLLTAEQGWGERALGQWLTLRLLDEDPSRVPTELAHPDLRWIAPDGAEIKVDAVRELAGFAYATAQQGGAKVIVFEDAHLLNRAAANALLKTLEEPPLGTFILLCSCFPGRLLPTVRSRCQRFHVRADASAARAWLARETGADDAELEARLYAAGGAPLAVLEELEEGRPPIGTLLDQAPQAPEPLARLDDLLALPPAALTGGWYLYLVGALAGVGHFPALAQASRRALLGFADELLWVRAQLLTTNSANARLLVGRLTSRWHELGASIS